VAPGWVAGLGLAQQERQNAAVATLVHEGDMTFKAGWIIISCVVLKGGELASGCQGLPCVDTELKLN